MLVAVVGGNLQGVEVSYLAQKADWEVIVIDRKPVVPASGICDRFVQSDITGEQNLDELFKGVDLIIPALENESALFRLNEFILAAGIPFAFDLSAYSVSSSKIKSDRLFAKIGVPAPKPWPNCNFPVVAKPSVGSGSQGVRVIDNSDALRKFFNTSDTQWVVQEYVQGPSYSIEVLGVPGNFTAIQVTDLEMDAGYDCKRVVAPTQLSEMQASAFQNISIEIAQALGLKGLMDVEAILHEDRLKVLEIDARLPSQTPTAVYWSSGRNMVEMLANLLFDKNAKSKTNPDAPKGVVYEHIRVSPGFLEVSGEHIMSGADVLHIQRDFFGADEAVTNYAAGLDNWVATLIISENDRNAAWDKRNSVIAHLKKKFKVHKVLDPAPSV